LGAGRERKEDIVDPGVGITLHAKIGDLVQTGDPLATVRYSESSLWSAQESKLGDAWSIGAEPAEAPGLILERIDATNI
jgi:pyrimidine-nucleoside phosphorylase